MLFSKKRGVISTEASCAAPVIDHGRVTDGPKVYRENEILNYVCDNKYKPADERNPRCLKVGAEVVWSPTPQCTSKCTIWSLWTLPCYSKLIIGLSQNTEITCKVDLPPVGTSYNQNGKNVFSPGDRLTVTCDRDHWILDMKTTRTVVTCNEVGKWDIRPVCQGKIWKRAALQKKKYKIILKLFSHSRSYM